MFTVLSNTRNSNLYIIIALAITLVVFLTLVVVPSIAAPKPAVIPVTGSQNAYAEFLSGEKVMYAAPAGLSQAILAYHAGERAAYASTIDSSSALSVYRLGEKVIYANSADLGDALSAWHFAEKGLLGSDGLEEALWNHRMGEKGLK